jgi:hypothetical protein
MCRERVSDWLCKIPTKVSPAGRCLRRRRGMADFRTTTTGAAPTSPPEGVFRLILRKEYRQLLEQGQRSRIRWSSRTVLRDYGPKEAASSRRRAVGTAGPFQGPRADREQRTPPSNPPGQRTIQGTTGRDGSAGRLFRSTPQQVDDMTTRPSGSGPTSQSDARDFVPKLIHADRPTGRGQGSQITSD